MHFYGVTERVTADASMIFFSHIGHSPYTVCISSHITLFTIHSSHPPEEKISSEIKTVMAISSPNMFHVSYNVELHIAIFKNKMHINSTSIMLHPYAFYCLI